MEEDSKTRDDSFCPKCASPLSEVITTATGRKLQRCTAGNWNPETRTAEGCNFVKWLPVEPQTLDEKCPKCGSPLILTVTRYGSKLKKCSTNIWDKATRSQTGCDYMEWIKGTTKELEEICPQCGAKLVLYTSAKGRRMKKCSTSSWDKEKRQPTGCSYIYWLKPGELEDQIEVAT